MAQKMAMSAASAVFLTLIALTISAEVNNDDKCPGVTAPCSCGEGRYGRSLICNGITSELELEDAVQQNTKEFHPEEFVLENSRLRFINQATFRGQTFLRFSIMNTTILSLTNTRQAFEGLEKTLIELVVEDCDFVTHWDWGHLKHLSHLTEIQMTRSDLVYGTDFEKLPEQVTVLRLHDNEIAGLVSDAFAKLPNLRTIDLNRNEIERIQRSMFPENAEQLATLDFSNNHLKELADDIFTDMPSLKNVRMKGNFFKTMSEIAFRPVWKKLKTLDMSDNPLVCDCGLRWIIEGDGLPLRFHANCKIPGFINSRVPVTELKRVHFRCH